MSSSEAKCTSYIIAEFEEELRVLQKSAHIVQEILCEVRTPNPIPAGQSVGEVFLILNEDNGLFETSDDESRSESQFPAIHYLKNRYPRLFSLCEERCSMESSGSEGGILERLELSIDAIQFVLFRTTCSAEMRAAIAQCKEIATIVCEKVDRGIHLAQKRCDIGDIFLRGLQTCPEVRRWLKTQQNQ
jgi:hypothetical protein